MGRLSGHSVGHAVVVVALSTLGAGCATQQWTHDLFAKREAERSSERDSEARNKRKDAWRKLCHATGSGARRRGAGFGAATGAACGPSTDSVMLPGNAFGFSIQPTTGMTRRKNRK